METPVVLKPLISQFVAQGNALVQHHRHNVSLPWRTTRFVEWMGKPMATPVLHGVHDNKSGAEVNAHVLPPHPAAVPLTTNQFVEWMARPLATLVGLGVRNNKSSVMVNAHVLPLYDDR